MAKNLDIRGVTPHEDIQVFITRCRRYLNKLYYHKSSGLSPLPMQPPQLRNLAIDFLSRPGNSPEDIILDSPSFNGILGRCNHLNRVSLKNFDFHRWHSFLGYLPHTMTEIDVFNEGFVENYGNPDAATHIDLSRFINLRALTLVNFTSRNILCVNKPVLHIRGMKMLGKLTHLRLHGDMWIEQLENIRNLEHVYIKQNINLQIDITTLVKNNDRLQYLALSNIVDLPTPALNAISTLRNLQSLVFISLSSGARAREGAGLVDLSPDRMTGMKNLKYLHFAYVNRIPKETLHRIIINSPKLQRVDVHKNFPGQNVQMIEAMEKGSVNRTSEARLQIFVGCDGLKKAKRLKNIPPYIVLDDVPQYEKLPSEHDFWHRWWTEDQY
ncbi:uncharacterized protein LOC107044409 [Diachasma alloeum]|uniref:uncharacterized protein LOC107044409 n=1 Tax=Diachasma alloeum TaxID=454923 RepID=UPI00073842EA|nr:uncharacterized protein LOC107044409 [Diachasma alloeum]